MKDKRTHRFSADYGLTDYRKFYIEKHGDIDTKLYSSVVRDFNKGIAHLIVEESMRYKIPFIGFEMFIAKSKRGPKLVNGQLVNTVPVDWRSTLDLWESDKEAKEKKLLVRYNNYHTSGYVFRIYVRKSGSKMKNKSYYRIRPNRKFQRSLSSRIKDQSKEVYDAFVVNNF